MNNINNQFPWINKHPNLIYADTGATSLKPQCVLDAINNFYINYGTNSHSTDSPISYETTNFVAQARSEIAEFINANENEIIFTSGATEGLNLIAFGIIPFLKENDEIITTYGEHSSNLIPWQVLEKEHNIKLKYAGKKEQLPSINDILELINENTKVVTFSSGYNLTGNQFDEIKITNAIKRKKPDVLVCIDMTQSIQHRRFDVKKCGCDFAVCSAHKIFGPTGIGLAYIKKEHQAQMKPLKYGGGMNFKIELHNFELLDNVEKFEGGTPNIEGIFGFRAAINFINQLGYDFIHQKEKELIEYVKQEFSKIKDLVILNKNFDVPIISFGFPGVFAQDLATYLGNNGIIVRGGLACAKLIPNIIGSYSPVRASLYIYNDKSDIDKICQCLKNYKKGDELNGIL